MGLPQGCVYPTEQTAERLKEMFSEEGGRCFRQLCLLFEDGVDDGLKRDADKALTLIKKTREELM